MVGPQYQFSSDDMTTHYGTKVLTHKAIVLVLLIPILIWIPKDVSARGTGETRPFAQHQNTM